MLSIPTIKLWSNGDHVIVEPGGSAEKIWKSRGYTIDGAKTLSKEPDKISEIAEEIIVGSKSDTNKWLPPILGCVRSPAPADTKPPSKKKRGRPKKKDSPKTTT